MIAELESLKTWPEFLALSHKQQLAAAAWVELAGQVGLSKAERRTKAVHIAFKCKSESSARAMGFALFNSPKMLSFQARLEGVPEKTLILNRLYELLNSPRVTENQIRVIELYCKIRGWIDQPIDGRKKAKQPDKPKKSKKTAEPDDGYDLSAYEPEVTTDATTDEQSEGNGSA